MAKNKDKKKKERERRVAQKKLAAAAKRREQENTTQEPQQSGPRSNKVFSVANTPKTNYVPTSKKSPFTQRRMGD